MLALAYRSKFNATTLTHRVTLLIELSCSITTPYARLQVIFSEDKQPYRQLDVSIRSGLYDKRYRICFANLQVQNAFFKLLDNPCPKCPGRTFVSFDLLKKHVSRDHQLFYCDLCTDNLKIFPFERRCYNRSDLALHNRKGDADDKSHRGHPLCEYCDVRYMDRDELFRHLRREHYFCHFCDADGSNQFYDDYSSLREHFNAKHFVCEEGGCAEEQFTGVFRTEIDLKAHQAKQHSSGMGKMAAKQARTLELEFSLVPRNRAGNGPGGGAAGPSGHQARGGDRDAQAGANGNGGGSSTINIVEGPSRLFNMVPSKRVIDSSNEQEFPSLSGGGSAPGGGGQSSGTSGASSSRQDASIRSKAFKAVGGSGKLNRTNENFPALGGGAAPIPPTSSSMGGNYKKVTASAVLKAKPTASNDEETRPAMKGTVIHISNRPKDFPALKKGARGAAAAAALAEDQSIAATEMMTQLHVNSNSISSKHRGLVDEYSIASAVAQKQGPKIGMVSAAPVATTTTTSSAAKPAKLKLKSEENFPSLSAGAGPSVGPWGGAPKWVAKPPKVESRKSKVAANPLLIINSKKEKNKQKIAADAKARGDGPSSSAGSNNTAFQLTNGGGVALPKKEHTGSKPIAPPGFERKAAKSTAPPPPPGFNVTLNSVSRNNNGAAGLTFTNSSGDKYKIVPTRRYIPPPNTLKRNQVGRIIRLEWEEIWS